MKILTLALVKKYFSDFTIRYVTNFYSHKNNKFFGLLCREKYSNLEIGMHSLCEHIELITSNAIMKCMTKESRSMLRKMCNQYMRELRNDRNFSIAECEKGQMTRSRVSKLLMMSNIKEILNVFKDTPLAPKLRLLYASRENFGNFEDEYERLLPVDKELLLSHVKTKVLPCYHDFYTAFVPLRIHKELETKKIKMLCHFNKLNEKSFYSINIKVPENNSVQFHRGKRFEHVVRFDNKEVINNHELTRAPNYPLRDVKYYDNSKRYHRLISRISFILNILNDMPNDEFGGILRKPFDIHIFESKYPKVINWYERVIANKKNNNGYRLTAEDQQVLHKFVGSLEINTGYSIIGHTPTNKIVVYRREELDKVLLHEFIHIFRVDTNIMDPKLVCLFKKHLKYDKFCNDFVKCDYQSDKFDQCEQTDKSKQCITRCTHYNIRNDSSILRVTEGYTDFCTDIINTFLYAVEISHYERGKIKSFDDLLNLFIDLLTIEINFAVFQAAKMLLYFNFDSYYDIYKNTNRNNMEITIKQSINEFLGEQYFTDTSFREKDRNRKNNSTIRQTTCVFSYFIIRVLLLLNIETIMKELVKFNDNDNLFQFLSTRNKNKATVIKNILVKSLISNKQPEISNIIDLYMETIKSLKVSKYDINKNMSDDERLKSINELEFSIDNQLAETMRRSIIEFK